MIKKWRVLILIFLTLIQPLVLLASDYLKNDLANGGMEFKSIRFRNDTVLIKPRWFIPDHYTLQYAGGIGFLSFGAGYNVRDKYEPSLFIGFVNKAFGNSTRAVTTISFKNSFNLFSRHTPDNIRLKGGIAVNMGYTNNTFRKLPPHYPEKYYFQNMVFLSPFIGGEWLFNIESKRLKYGGFYFEFTTRDAYLLECIRTRYVRFNEIWNLAIGLTLYIP